MSIFETELADMYAVYLKWHKTLDATKGYYQKPSFEHLCDILISNYTPSWFVGFEHIESYSDDIGEQCYSVFKWKDKHYRIPYSYRSHHGSDYWGSGSDIKEVKPVVKEVRVWE